MDKCGRWSFNNIIVSEQCFESRFMENQITEDGIKYYTILMILQYLVFLFRHRKNLYYKPSTGFVKWNIIVPNQINLYKNRSLTSNLLAGMYEHIFGNWEFYNHCLKKHVANTIKHHEQLMSTHIHRKYIVIISQWSMRYWVSSTTVKIWE